MAILNGQEIKTKLIIQESIKHVLHNSESVDYTYDKDITDMDASDLMKEFVRVMRTMGYHDVSIWRALTHNAEDLVELFESICGSDKEWSNNG